MVVVAEKDPEALRIINAQMRRIDLLCKLLGPLFIALIDGYSSEVAIVVNFAMNAASVVVEYFAIARVYWEVPELQRSKQEHQPSVQSGSSQDSGGLGRRSWQQLKIVVTRSATDFSFYFNHRAFLPSFAGAMLYLTVLSFAGQMVTYLLSAGYSSMQIGFARTLSVVFEVLATWFAPWLMGPIGIVRAGLWLSASQVITLAAGFAVFWICEKNSLLSASGLVVGTILSRLGLRGFDLCIQLIVQEVRVQPPHPVFSDAHRLLRTSRLKVAVRFPLLRPLGKMPLSFSHTLQLYFFTIRMSSSGPRFFLLQPSFQRV